MIDLSSLQQTDVQWTQATRIIRSLYPPIDLFEDIADPQDWDLLASIEMKTNPRLIETIGNLDLVPVARRVGGAGASYLMAPFTHISPDRPSRFSDGSFGVLYIGKSFETALYETVHHHAAFMARTNEAAGWTSQFREIVLDVRASLHDVRSKAYAALYDGADYDQPQTIGKMLKSRGSNGLVYNSVRYEGGECAALFYPDCASNPKQGRHLSYYWDGHRVAFYRDESSGGTFRL